MFKFSKAKVSLAVSSALLFFSTAVFAYTDIAVNSDGTPMKFTAFSSSQPLVWNPESGPMQDTSSAHSFTYYSEYQSYCSGAGAGGGGGSGSGCSMNPLLRDAMAASAVTNLEGIDLVTSAFNNWRTSATNASVSYSQGASLGVDVDVCNYPQFIDSGVSEFAIAGDANDPRVCGCLGTCPGQPCTNPVVFDANGDITALENGEGNRYSILGSAGPIVWPGYTNLIKFEAIINGVCLDNSPDTSCPSTFTNEQLLAVMTHELGHAQGLGHTQVNPKSIGFPAGTVTSPSGAAYLVSAAPWGVQGAVPTMYPLLVSGDNQATLALDDVAGLTHLYPGSTANYCTVNGNTYQGTAGLRCVEVVFRDQSSTVLNAVGVVSGQEAANNGSDASALSRMINSCTASPQQNCGSYSVKLPAGTYNVEVNAIPDFGPGSTIGPCGSTNPAFAGVNQSTGWLLSVSGGSCTTVTCTAGGTATCSDTITN